MQLRKAAIRPQTHLVSLNSRLFTFKSPKDHSVCRNRFPPALRLVGNTTSEQEGSKSYTNAPSLESLIFEVAYGASHPSRTPSQATQTSARPANPIVHASKFYGGNQFPISSFLPALPPHLLHPANSSIKPFFEVPSPPFPLQPFPLGPCSFMVLLHPLVLSHSVVHE